MGESKRKEAAKKLTVLLGASEMERINLINWLNAGFKSENHGERRRFARLYRGLDLQTMYERVTSKPGGLPNDEIGRTLDDFELERDTLDFLIKVLNGPAPAVLGSQIELAMAELGDRAIEVRDAKEPAEAIELVAEAAE